MNFAGHKRVAETLKTTMRFLLTGEHEVWPSDVPPRPENIFTDGGEIFDGYAQITIRKLIPRRGK